MTTTIYRLRPILTRRCHIRPRRVYPLVPQRSRQLNTKPSEPESQGKNGGEQQRPKGSYTRVFGTFAVGGVLGWAVHTYLDDGKVTNTGKPGDFVRYVLTEKVDISSTCSVFTLKPASRTTVDADALYDRRAITSVQVKQPQLQIARSYTVLPPVAGQDPQELRFLIRQERSGEVSGYLHRLALGAEVELRGPSVDYVLPERVQQVLFLAGGTGIVPAMQVADKLAGDIDMHILWATRKREDCEGGVSDTQLTKTASGWSFFGWWSPFGLSPSEAGSTVSVRKHEPNAVVSQIINLKEQDRRTKVDYYVDEEGTFMRPGDITALAQVSTESTAETDAQRRLLFVSGPEGFITYWAGPKQWAGGREVQGPLGGVLSTLDLRGWQVVKL
ncbi:hypothetical protein LTR85_003781 [Meristemomyces frigidus]|nr:hypothetical protein LTR85_003781 [Meristemomyces frigidus]